MTKGNKSCLGPKERKCNDSQKAMLHSFKRNQTFWYESENKAKARTNAK